MGKKAKNTEIKIDGKGINLKDIDEGENLFSFGNATDYAPIINLSDLGFTPPIDIHRNLTSGEFEYIKIPINNCIDFEKKIDCYAPTKNNITFIGDPIFENKNKQRKENNKTMRLLEIYKNKQEEEIKLRYKKQEEDILEKDELVAIAKEYNAKLKFLIADEEMIEKRSLIKDRVITEYSKKAIKLLVEQKNKELEKLYQFIDIIEAQLEIAETYEQKQEILKTYKILNDDNSFSKLINENKDEEETKIERKNKKARKEY